jgi:acyl-CoA reductase-like NAD-dependent aldehyde dehydrogenase
LPTGLKDNDDYTSVVNQRHFDRLNSYLDDAREKGAEVVEINPQNENFSQQPHHKMAPHIVLNPTDDMKVMQDEIFGPILPVKTYTEIRRTRSPISMTTLVHLGCTISATMRVSARWSSTTPLQAA